MDKPYSLDRTHDGGPWWSHPVTGFLHTPRTSATLQHSSATWVAGKPRGPARHRRGPCSPEGAKPASVCTRGRPLGAFPSSCQFAKDTRLPGFDARRSPHSHCHSCPQSWGAGLQCGGGAGWGHGTPTPVLPLVWEQGASPGSDSWPGGVPGLPSWPPITPDPAAGPCRAEAVDREGPVTCLVSQKCIHVCGDRGPGASTQLQPQLSCPLRSQRGSVLSSQRQKAQPRPCDLEAGAEKAGTPTCRRPRTGGCQHSPRESQAGPGRTQELPSSEAQGPQAHPGVPRPKTPLKAPASSAHCFGGVPRIP